MHQGFFFQQSLTQGNMSLYENYLALFQEIKLNHIAPYGNASKKRYDFVGQLV